MCCPLRLVGGLVVYLFHRSCNSICNMRTPCYSLYQWFLFLFYLISCFSLVRLKISLQKALSDIKLGLEEKQGEGSWQDSSNSLCPLLILYAESIIRSCEYKTSYQTPNHLKSRVGFFEHGLQHIQLLSTVSFYLIFSDVLHPSLQVESAKTNIHKV